MHPVLGQAYVMAQDIHEAQGIATDTRNSAAAANDDVCD